MRDAVVGVGAEAGELFQSGACCHGLEVAKEAVPRQERLIDPLRGDDLTCCNEGVVMELISPLAKSELLRKYAK